MATAKKVALSNECDELAVEASMAQGSTAGRSLAVLTLASGLGTRVIPQASVQAQATDPDQPAMRSLVGYAVSFALTSVVRANELLAAAPNSGFAFRHSPFDCPPDKTPSVSVAHYIERFLKYTPAPREVLIAAIAYIDRFLGRNSVGVSLSPWNIHRLFAVAFVIASKWVCDHYYSNKFYSKVAGLSLQELNGLERIFLAETNYCLDMTPAGYEQYAMPVLMLGVIAGVRGDLPAFICATVRELRAQWAASASASPPTATSTTATTIAIPSSPWGSQQQQQQQQQQQMAMSLSTSASPSPSPSHDTHSTMAAIKQSPATFSMQL